MSRAALLLAAEKSLAAARADLGSRWERDRAMIVAQAVVYAEKAA